GDGGGEVPGRDDEDDAEGREGGAVDVEEVGDLVTVPAGEVDGLGDLGVGLGDGLVAFVDEGSGEGLAQLAVGIGGAVEGGSPVLGRHVGEGGLGGDGERDAGVDGVDVGGDGLGGRCGWGGDDALSPLAVGGEGGVGEGLVDEGARGGGGV